MIEHEGPPCDLEIEQAVLGALVHQQEWLTEIPLLRAEHFFEPLHGRIFSAIQKADNSNQSVTPATISASLTGDPALQEMGGKTYFASLMAASAIDARSLRSQADALIDLANLRKVRDVLAAQLSRANAPTLDDTAERIALEAQAALDGVLETRAGDGLASADQIGDAVLRQLNDAMQNPGQSQGISTGLADLDRITGGLQPGGLYVIGARASMGKTALALAVAANVAQQGYGVATFSLEMTHREVFLRMVSIASGIPYADAMIGRLDNAEALEIFRAGDTVKQWPVSIDDRAGIGPAYIRSVVRRYANQLRRGGQKLGLIVVDYLGLLSEGGRGMNRAQELGGYMKALKAIAKEHDCPLISPAQINRQVENTQPTKSGDLASLLKARRPQLHHLRDSGDIEQDADVVLLLFRPEYYAERDPTLSLDDQAVLAVQANKAEIKVAKNRLTGRTGLVTVWCDVKTNQFKNLIRSGDVISMRGGAL